MKINLLTVIIILSLSFSSCKKEGCTDPESKAYDEKAKKDNGSCTYDGSLVFWYTSEVMENLQNEDIRNLSYYVDDELAGEASTSLHFNSAPECTDETAISVNKDFSTNKSKIFRYSIKDQGGVEIWKGTIEVDANTCMQLELKY